MAHSPWDPYTPFSLNPMRPKGAKGQLTSPQGQVGPKPQVGPHEPILAPDLNNPKNGQKDPRTQIGQEPHFGHFQTLASGSHQRPSAQVWKVFPSIQRKTSPLPIYSIPKDPCMVHIWYNIPLCTIFSQKSNDDVCRTKLFLLNSSPQIHHPFRRKNLSVIQSSNPWRLPEDHSRTPTTWPCRSWVVISFQDYSKGNFKRLSIIQSAFKTSNTSVFFEQLNW
ncbi:hypothetical protein O181_017223 [Austropuccinia psidii MF-1]|uniref:Uncharacterized protein n=1 Tax=Austropuccinia psidii MF-1 TaxID=1389203 RepID=A0A9Q3C6Q4_9BASI|nr:hypothetical protein [Austropuccinia psidii MF-1]